MGVLGRLGVLISIVVVLIAACGDSRPARDDDDSSSVASVGSGGGGGGAVTASSANSTTSTASVASSSATGGSAELIGATCSVDADCGVGLRCLEPTDDSIVFFGGAPAGYCTKDCTMPAECPTGSTCLINQNGLGECFLDCVLGPALMFIDDAVPSTKCHGRMDTMCRNVAGDEVCIPVCGTNAQCGGRVCDPRTALCRDAANTGTPHGLACDPNAPNEDGCAGVCQAFSTNFGVCTTFCSLGGMPYQQQADCNGMANGVCLYSAGPNGAGDWGACAPRCFVQAACATPDLVCRTLGISQAGEGYCYFGTPCPTGNECASLTQPVDPDHAWQCVATSFGDTCLEVDTTNGNQLVFPLQ